MLFTMARARPWRARTLRSSLLRANTSEFSLTVPVIPFGSSHWSLPFGPSARTAPVSDTVSFTLLGIWIGLFPIRDIGRFWLMLTKRRQAILLQHSSVLLRGRTQLQSESRGWRSPSHRARAELPLLRRI